MGPDRPHDRTAGGCSRRSRADPDDQQILIPTIAPRSSSCPGDLGARWLDRQRVAGAVPHPCQNRAALAVSKGHSRDML